MKKIFILLISLLLCSCGIGMFGVATENTIFLNEKDAGVLKTKCGFHTGNFICGKEFEKESIYEEKKLGKITIDLQVFGNDKLKVLSFGILPLVPAPPIIPTFFFPAIGHKEFCSTGYLRVDLSFVSDYEEELKNVKIDLNNIYILKDNEKIYATNYTKNTKIFYNNFQKKNHYTDHYIIDFPIDCKETHNTLIFIENVKVNGEEIDLPVGKIVYGSGWGFVMGYFVNN